MRIYTPIITLLFVGRVFSMMGKQVHQDCKQDDQSAAVYGKKLSEYYSAADKKAMAFGGTAKTMIIKHESPKNTFQEFAVKVIEYDDSPSIEEENKTAKNDLENEIAALEIFKDSTILTKYYGCYEKREKNIVSVFMVFEKLAGEILNGDARKESAKSDKGGNSPQKKALTSSNSQQNKTPADAFNEQNPSTKCMIFGSLSQQLGELHSSGVAHNDLKPSNIMLVKPDGKSAKIIDFGAASEDQSEITFFTIAYADYELRMFNTATLANDVFSFGLAIGEIIIGENVVVTTYEENKRNIRKPIDLIRAQIKALFDKLASDKSKVWTMKFGNASLYSLLSKMTDPVQDNRPPIKIVEKWFNMLAKLHGDPNATDDVAAAELAKFYPGAKRALI